MKIYAIIFIVTAIIGAVVNFSSKKISDKYNISELKIKCIALAVVLISVMLLMIFGK